MTKSAAPCRRCGGPKRPIRGAQYCDECRLVTQPAAAARHAATKALRLKAEREERRIAEGRPRRRISQAVTPEGTKWCGYCEKYLTVASFKTRGDGRLSPYCKPCQKAYNHGHRIKQVYGVSPEEYQSLFDAQDGRCAICQNQPRGYQLAVDHDHITGQVRGLLCSRCNRNLLGSARDNIEILRRAVKYMANPPATRNGSPIAERLRESDLTFEEGLLAVVDQLEDQRSNAGTTFAVAFIRRPGGRWIAVQTIQGWATSHREATMPAFDKMDQFTSQLRFVKIPDPDDAA